MSSDQVKLVTICQYLTDINVQWRDADYKAMKMVKALKGDAINGYFDHKIGDKVVRFTNENIGDFLKRIPRAMLGAIRRHVNGKATIVPIPNSQVTRSDAPNFRTLDLAKAVAECSEGQFAAAPGLVFKRPQQKSHEGGPRDPRIIVNEYNQTIAVPSGSIVLLDDVCTTGGHMIAACWKLRAPWRSVVLASAFGRTTWEPFQDPLGIHEETLDITRP